MYPLVSPEIGRDDSESLSLLPVAVRKHSLCILFSNMAVFVSAYIAHISITNVQSLPYDFVTAHSPSRHTESNAF